ncbi:hypothetical protein [Kocuria sp.]|uniref:hypothetical protein n=1 Tax=Kocuria sp. TaxID=1871328 RepID=UPI0026E06367|nr:hypothetical protein [Kocuria sp.]MDO5617937.1 hypothetical protein [Kocuria sp.]
MARDDSGGRSQGGHGQDAYGDSNSWDFDLPDLGDSTPVRRRSAGSNTASQGRQGQDSFTTPAGQSQRDVPEDAGAVSRDDYADRDHHGDYYDSGDDFYDHAASETPHRGGAWSEPGAATGGRVHGPEVYRRRRMIALIIAVLLVGALGFGLMSLLGGGDQAEPELVVTAQPTNTDPFAGFTARPESQASDGATGPAARACGDKLKVSASTDHETYDSDAKPILIMSLENTGDDPCMVNAGTARMNFSVTSGPDKVFDSAACQIEGQDRPIELKPGQTETARFEWDKRRSVTDCATEGAEVNPGSYRLTVALGETRSEGAEFTLE